MAKVVGPLMSMDASGSVDKTLIFSKNKGRNYVKTHAIPSNPNTPAQQKNRIVWAGLNRIYTANQSLIDSQFSTIATQEQITPLNAYLKFNIPWLQTPSPVFDYSNPGPTLYSPVSLVEDITDLTASDPIVNFPHITLPWTFTYQDNWPSIVICANQTGDITFTPDTIIHIGLSTEMSFDWNLPSNDYWIMFAAIGEAHGTLIGPTCIWEYYP